MTWTTGGEYYRNQIEADNYKNMFMLDSKLTFNITKRLELSASLTNILNRKEYSYTSVFPGLCRNMNVRAVCADANS